MYYYYVNDIKIMKCPFMSTMLTIVHCDSRTLIFYYCAMMPPMNAKFQFMHKLGTRFYVLQSEKVYFGAGQIISSTTVFRILVRIRKLLNRDIILLKIDFYRWVIKFYKGRNQKTTNWRYCKFDHWIFTSSATNWSEITAAATSWMQFWRTPTSEK